MGNINKKSSQEITEAIKSAKAIMKEVGCALEYSEIKQVLTEKGYEKEFASDVVDNIVLELGSYLRAKWQDKYVC